MGLKNTRGAFRNPVAPSQGCVSAGWLGPFQCEHACFLVEFCGLEPLWGWAGELRPKVVLETRTQWCFWGWGQDFKNPDFRKTCWFLKDMSTAPPPGCPLHRWVN